jgi:hypothetical protein
MDIGSVILVIIAVILWAAIFTEIFVNPLYKKYFKGSLLWPDDPVTRNRLKKCIQGLGLYYLTSVILLMFSPAMAILMGFMGLFYALALYFWLTLLKKG